MLKKSIWYSIFLLNFQFIGLSQDIECVKNIKTGKFVYKSADEFVIIKRTKRKQIEIYGKSKIILKVKWIDDTNFILTYVKSIRAPEGCLKKGENIFVKIIECDGKKYKASFTSKYCSSGVSSFVKL